MVGVLTIALPGRGVRLSIYYLTIRRFSFRQIQIREVVLLSKTTWNSLSRFGATVFLAIVAALGPLGAEEPPGAAERLLATERATVDTSPHLAALHAAVHARVAETQATAAAGTPYMELQQEGVGSGFTWELNAQTTLRIGTPFNLPSQGRARRDLRSAAGQWSTAAYQAAVLESTREVGLRWLDLAAVEERLAIGRRRLSRLERALDLERVRLDLGEVAGTDVTQIELAWAGVMSMVKRLESDRKTALEALRQYCADRCVLPEAGDLQDLVPLTSTLQVDGDSTTVLERSPLWRTPSLRADVDRGSARVMEASAWGRPEAELEWEHVPGLEGLPSYDAFGMRLRFPLPTGSSGSKTREAARARMLEAEAGLRLERVRMKTRLESALTAARSAEETLAQLEPVVLKVEGSEHSLAEQFRLGAISYLVYMDGVSRFDEVQLQAVDARRSLLGSRLELAVLGADSSCFPIPELPTAQEQQEQQEKKEGQ